MHPRLLTTPFFTLHTFGVLLALAFLAAMWWVVRAARRDGLNPDRLVSLGLWAIAGSILGAKLLLVLRTGFTNCESLAGSRRRRSNIAPGG